MVITGEWVTEVEVDVVMAYFSVIYFSCSPLERLRKITKVSV
jgi:hypothetical protein